MYGEQIQEPQGYYGKNEIETESEKFNFSHFGNINDLGLQIEPTEFIEYEVQQGETLYYLAGFFKCSVQQILELNSDIDIDKKIIRAGEKIKIPYTKEFEIAAMSHIEGDLSYFLENIRKNKSYEELLEDLFNKKMSFIGAQLEALDIFKTTITIPNINELIQKSAGEIFIKNIAAKVKDELTDLFIKDLPIASEAYSLIESFIVDVEEEQKRFIDANEQYQMKTIIIKWQTTLADIRNKLLFDKTPSIKNRVKVYENLNSNDYRDLLYANIYSQINKYELNRRLIETRYAFLNLITQWINDSSFYFKDYSIMKQGFKDSYVLFGIKFNELKPTLTSFIINCPFAKEIAAQLIVYFPEGVDLNYFLECRLISRWERNGCQVDYSYEPKNKKYDTNYSCLYIFSPKNDEQKEALEKKIRTEYLVIIDAIKDKKFPTIKNIRGKD